MHCGLDFIRRTTSLKTLRWEIINLHRLAFVIIFMFFSVMTFQKFCLISRYFLDAIGCNPYFLYGVETRKSSNHRQKSWDTFAFLGRFSIHTSLIPPLTPQTTLDACIKNFFRVSTLYRVGGEGELQENFEKDALFYEGKRKLQKIMNTAFRSKRLLSIIVAVS